MYYNLEAETGFEPVNDGFANRCVRPLRHSAELPTYLPAIINNVFTQ